MACNIKFIVLIIKASFFLAMGILEIVTARNTIVEKWSADRDIGFAMSVLNAAQNVCKLIQPGGPEASFRHLQQK